MNTLTPQILEKINEDLSIGSIINETPFKIGDIVSRTDASGLVRIGDIVLNSSNQRIVYMHNPFTGVYYGNCSIEKISTEIHNDYLSFIRSEKIESIFKPYTWVRMRENYPSGTFKNHLLVKEYV